jgi:hypothetical protein
MPRRIVALGSGCGADGPQRGNNARQMPRAFWQILAVGVEHGLGEVGSAGQVWCPLVERVEGLGDGGEIHVALLQTLTPTDAR